jgi:DNA-binding response OmpR family regulator
MPKRRILLIEDEPSIVKMVGKRLEVSGYEVLTATDGQDGLAKARVGRPDAIILDLMLPRLSGFEICAALKSDPRYQKVPIIIFTGKGQDMDEKLCRELGAEAYITKPQQSKALLEQLEALLAHVLPENS